MKERMKRYSRRKNKDILKKCEEILRKKRIKRHYERKEGREKRLKERKSYEISRKKEWRNINKERMKRYQERKIKGILQKQKSEEI